MKKNLKTLLASVLALMMLLTASVALGETKITVSGTGETKVAADTAIITLGVSARDKDVLKAQQKVNESIAAIRQALIAKGVKEENINTDYLNIFAMYDYKDDMEEVIAYNANSTLAIKVEKIDDAGMLIDEAFAAGANTLNGITFSADDTDAAEKESLKKAVEAAMVKAETLAEAAGLKITGIEIVTDGGVYNYGNSVSNFSARAKGADIVEEAEMDAGTIVQAAKLIVTANVQITFTAE